MLHKPERVECLDICRTCHLVWPCMDGRVLTHQPTRSKDRAFSVDEIRQAIIERDEQAYAA